jgi:hypothetical protein
MPKFQAFNKQIEHKFEVRFFCQTQMQLQIETRNGNFLNLNIPDTPERVKARFKNFHRY